MKKKILAVILAAAMMLTFASCAKKGVDYEYSFADKTYIYEKEGAGGSFVISIKSDGTFTYTEGPDANYEAHGAWTYVDGTLSLIDDLHGTEQSISNNFFFVDGNLWYISEYSTGFANVNVEDGDLFIFAYENAASSEATEEHAHDH